MADLKDELLFFMSYAQADDKPGPPGLVRRFFEDLRREVAQRVGQANHEQVAYLDRDKLEPGDIWPYELSSALARCRTFIGIVSPTYLTRPFCGKEWSVFEERCRQYHDRIGGKFPPVILPVLWLPEIEGRFPDYVTDRQVSFDADTADENQRQFLLDYEKKGMKFVIQRLSSTHLNAYTTIVEELAQRIINVAQSYPLEPTPPQLVL